MLFKEGPFLIPIKPISPHAPLLVLTSLIDASNAVYQATGASKTINVKTALLVKSLTSTKKNVRNHKVESILIFMEDNPNGSLDQETTLRFYKKEEIWFRRMEALFRLVATIVLTLMESSASIALTSSIYTLSNVFKLPKTRLMTLTPTLTSFLKRTCKHTQMPQTSSG